MAGSERDLDRAIAVEPDAVECLVSRGIIRGQRGDVTGAMDDLARATELDPRHVKGRAFRAVLRSGLGDVAGAREDAERALELMGPDDPNRRTMQDLLASLRGR